MARVILEMLGRIKMFDPLIGFPMNVIELAVPSEQEVTIE